MRVENRRWRRKKLVALVLVAAAFATLLSGRLILLPFAVRVVLYAFLFFFALPQSLGDPGKQPYLELSARGVRYGRRRLISWRDIEDARWRALPRGRRALVLTRRGNRIRRLLGRARKPLPLSEYDRAVPAEAWEGALGRYAPDLPIVRQGEAQTNIATSGDPQR